MRVLLCLLICAFSIFAQQVIRLEKKNETDKELGNALIKEFESKIEERTTNKLKQQYEQEINDIKSKYEEEILKLKNLNSEKEKQIDELKQKVKELETVKEQNDKLNSELNNFQTKIRELELQLQNSKANALKEIRQKVIIDTAKMLGFRNPSNVVSLVPSGISEYDEVRQFLEFLLSKNKYLKLGSQFCDDEFISSQISIDIVDNLTLQDFIEIIRREYDASFVIDADVQDTKLMIKANKIDWAKSLKENLKLLDLGYTCKDNIVYISKRDKINRFNSYVENINLDYFIDKQKIFNVIKSLYEKNLSRIELYENFLVVEGNLDEVKKIKDFIANLQNSSKDRKRIGIRIKIFGVRNDKIDQFGGVASMLSAYKGSEVAIQQFPQSQQQSINNQTQSQGFPKRNIYSSPIGTNEYGMANNAGFLGLSFVVGNSIFRVALGNVITRGIGKIYNEPQVVVMENETGIINIGRNLYVPIISFTNQGSQNANLQTIQAGNSLEVTPIYVDKDKVRFKLSIQSNDVDTSVSIQGIPAVNTRKVETIIEIKKGETFILGGFNTIQESKSKQKTWLSLILPFVNQVQKIKTDEFIFFAIEYEDVL
ncbi:MAG: hypothetical protein N2505_00450 [Endomicrobia bacterium]|nr:hypothetical protein [Endomicrobiia bacterium]